MPRLFVWEERTRPPLPYWPGPSPHNPFKFKRGQAVTTERFLTVSATPRKRVEDGRKTNP